MNLFKNFPKTRPELPDAFKKIYKSNYKENREGKTIFSALSLKAEAWQHVQVAKDLSDGNNKSTLEIGAGTLNHLPYELNNPEYDIIEPQKELYELSTLLKNVRNIYCDLSEVPETTRYDRIISCNAFKHICNLPEVVAYCGLLLNKGGTMRIGIPSEGTLLWSLSWRLTRGVEFKVKYALDYGVLMKYEHVNNAKEIEETLQYFFRTTQGKAMGLSRSLSLYQFYVCSSPDEEKCRKYIDSCK